MAKNIKSPIITTPSQQTKLNEVKKHIKEYNSLSRGKGNGKSALKICMSVTINNQEYTGHTISEICRKLEVSLSTVNHWMQKDCTLQEAAEKATQAKNKTKSKEIIIFNRKFKSLAEACKDHIVNRKYKLPIKTIQVRVRKGMTPELAFTTPLPKSRFRHLELTLPNGTIIESKTVRGIIKELELAGFNHPPETTIVSRLAKGENIETALGLTTRPWLLKKQKAIELLVTKGYKIIKQLRHEGEPIIIHSAKQIYPSAKEFSKSYNFSIDTVYDKLKEGKTADEIIEFYEKRGKNS